MKAYFMYVYFGLYMIYSLFVMIKIIFIRKFISNEKAEEAVFKFASSCARRLVKLSSMKVNIIGEEKIPEGPCLFVANHQGLFDILILIAYIKRVIGFIAKKEAKKIPLASWWMKAIHCVFIDRENTREGLKSINEGIENLKKGYSMVIFPEGTRSRSSVVGEFKKGSMRLAVKSGVPIVPITIDGTYKAFEANHGKLRSSSVNITFSDPIYASNYSKEEQSELSNIVRAIIAEQIRD